MQFGQILWHPEALSNVTPHKPIEGAYFRLKVSKNGRPRDIEIVCAETPNPI